MNVRGTTSRPTTRELRVDDLSLPSVTIYVCPKDFLDFKTSVGIHLYREDFNLESLLASNIRKFMPEPLYIRMGSLLITTMTANSEQRIQSKN